MAALAGLTVTCFATGGPTLVGQLQQLPSRAWWSEQPATDTATTNYAPGQASEFGPNIFRLYSAIDVWVSIGQVPDATASGRVFLPAESERDYIVSPGDKLEWIADA